MTERRRRTVLVVLSLVAVSAAAALGLARMGAFGEPVEHVFGNEVPEVRAPDGELLPAVSGTAVVWAIGDADDGIEARALAATVTRSRPARLLYLGDVYPYGGERAFERWSDVWGALASRTAPTPGNHEWGEGAEGYDPYWESVHGEPVPSYYALRAGGWEILSLNSEAPHGAGSDQERWLAAQVAKRRGDCRIVFWHRPRFSAGPRGDTASLEPLSQHLPGQARLLLAGHEHNLQQLRAVAGVTQLVVGAGGRGHAPLDRADPRLAFADDERTGGLRLVLVRGRATWAFVTADGTVIRRGVARCTPLT